MCRGRTVMAGVVERRAVLAIQQRLHLSPAHRLQEGAHDADMTGRGGHVQRRPAWNTDTDT